MWETNMRKVARMFGKTVLFIKHMKNGNPNIMKRSNLTSNENARS